MLCWPFPPPNHSDASLLPQIYQKNQIMCQYNYTSTLTDMINQMLSDGDNHCFLVKSRIAIKKGGVYLCVSHPCLHSFNFSHLLQKCDKFEFITYKHLQCCNLFVVYTGLPRLLKFLKYPKIWYCLLNILECPKILFEMPKSLPSPPKILLTLVCINPVI